MTLFEKRNNYLKAIHLLNEKEIDNFRAFNEIASLVDQYIRAFKSECDSIHENRKVSYDVRTYIPVFSSYEDEILSSIYYNILDDKVSFELYIEDNPIVDKLCPPWEVSEDKLNTEGGHAKATELKEALIQYFLPLQQAREKAQKEAEEKLERTFFERLKAKFEPTIEK